MTFPFLTDAQDSTFRCRRFDVCAGQGIREGYKRDLTNVWHVYFRRSDAAPGNRYHPAGTVSHRITRDTPGGPHTDESGIPYPLLARLRGANQSHRGRYCVRVEHFA